MNLSTTEPPEITERKENDSLTGEIIGAAIEIYKKLGPGLLESAYGACLAYELRLRKLKIECEKPLPIYYKDVMLEGIRRLKFKPLSVISVLSVVFFKGS